MRRGGLLSLYFMISACGSHDGASSNQDSLSLLQSENAKAGYVQFIPQQMLQTYLRALPHVSDTEINAMMHSPETMWYDKEHLEQVYQDSIGPVFGVRANSIAMDIAVEGNRVWDNYDNFHFPYTMTAGLQPQLHNRDTHVLVFWSPPRENGQTLPVVYYKDNTTRWRWIFPKGTLFGELMLQKNPQGQWIAYEVRTRKKINGGWATNAFRPFHSAEGLSAAVKELRPQWESVSSLRNFINHLQNNSSLTSKRLTSKVQSTRNPPGPIPIEPIDGYLDLLPDPQDPELVTSLLTSRVFTSAEGQVWKRDGSKESYAASSAAGYSIVPSYYEGGLYPVNDVSCNRCHQDTGRQVGEFNFNTLLYGEVWGEDRIFSWHLFDKSGNFYGAFDENRILSRDLESAGLVARYNQSIHTQERYQELSRRFKIYWR